MTDMLIRQIGHAGRVTLNRPDALNSVTHAMCLSMETALDAWADDPQVDHVVIDAAGDRAFCAGGDIADLYAKGRAGDFEFGRRFWADEYRLNAKIYRYPKPFISFMQGFTMGGGVGLGCHGSHRIVGPSSRIAMPECGIGLIPDVGGSLLLARAPGLTGTYLGLTGARMGAADAIYAGFADHVIPEADWPQLIGALEAGAGPATLATHAQTPEPAELESAQTDIDRIFGVENLTSIVSNLTAESSPFALKAKAALSRAAPLSAACTCEVLRRLRASDLRIETALALEYRFTSRAAEHGDLLEGIRAAIIDKDKSPQWRFADGVVPKDAVSAMLAPVEDAALNLEASQ